jgi:hypothetical protein
MALNQVKIQKLKNEGYIELYEKNKEFWDDLTKKACAYAVSNMLPVGEVIRPDDITDFLVPVVRMQSLFTKHSQKKKSVPQYVCGWFCDFIIGLKREQRNDYQEC